MPDLSDQKQDTARCLLGACDTCENFTQTVNFYLPPLENNDFFINKSLKKIFLFLNHLKLLKIQQF